MKKLFWLLVVCIAMACGDSGRNQDREAAGEEEVEVGAGEEISPQLELDSAGSRFEVDSVSSASEADRESEKESF